MKDHSKDCPYYLKWLKLSNEGKIEYPTPCHKCMLDPNVCIERLIWAYNQKK